MAAPRPSRDKHGPDAALSRELADFLVEFSIVLHKRAMYPAGHPFLQSSAVRFADRLERLLELRETITFGVARNKLVIESVTTDPSNALLRDLAQRLHRHQLASIGFSLGATVDEIDRLLTALSLDPDRGDGPLGRRLETTEQWEHIQLRTTGYARLALRETPTESEPEKRDFWLELAKAALEGRHESDAAGDVDPLIVTNAGERGGQSTEYDSVVLDYLAQIAEERSGRGGIGEERLRRRVSQLLNALDPESLKRLLEAGADHARLNRTRLDESKTLAVDAVVSVLEAAARSDGHTISHYLLRILHKLARQPKTDEEAVRTEADADLRRNVARLISDWQLADPNPGTYTLILEGMVREMPVLGAFESATRCDPDLVLRMAVEVGSAGRAACAAAEILSTTDRVQRVAEILGAAQSPEVADFIWAHVATPERLRVELEAELPDQSVVQILAARLGDRAVEPLLDALARATGRSSRAALMKHLYKLGPDAAHPAAERLPGAPWYFQRNILLLIGQWRTWPEGFTPLPYVLEGDVRVRREAVKLMLASPEHRATAITLALRDTDDGIVTLALSAVADSCPPDALPLVERVATTQGRDSRVRVQAVRALARIGSAAAVPALVGLVQARRRWLRSPLAPKSPEVLAAIAALANRWRNDPQAAALLSHARRHPDADIRNAAGGASA